MLRKPLINQGGRQILMMGLTIADEGLPEKRNSQKCNYFASKKCAFLWVANSCLSYSHSQGLVAKGQVRVLLPVLKHLIQKVFWIFNPHVLNLPILKQGNQFRLYKSLVRSDLQLRITIVNFP